MSDTEMQMPQPTKEHCGVWNVDCTFFMGPDQPPMKVQAKEAVEMSGRGNDCMTGGMVDYRTTEVHGKDGARTFEMFMKPDGAPEEMKLFTHVYTRAS